MTTEADSDPAAGAVVARAGKDAAIAAGGAVAGYLVGGPEGAVLGAGAPALIESGWAAVATTLGRRRRERVGFVVAYAAKCAGVKPDELAAELQRDPAAEELFIRTLTAAQDAALTEKLMAFAMALSATFDDSSKVGWESAFVRALDPLDHAGLRVLSWFNETPVMLGLTPDDRYRGAVDETVLWLRWDHLNDIASRRGVVAVLEQTLATLEQVGLLAPLTTGQSYQSSLESKQWGVTDFGRAFLSRMQTVSGTIKAVS